MPKLVLLHGDDEALSTLGAGLKAVGVDSKVTLVMS